MPTKPSHWLMKCEPDAYSIDDLKRDGKTSWEGVRNYQARNFMRDQMQIGDWVFFYHSNAEPSGIAGIAKVCKSGYTDATALDPKSKYFDEAATPSNPRWVMVDIQFIEKFPRLITLEDLRRQKSLAKMVVLQKGSRLSVQPVTAEEFDSVKLLAVKNS